MYSGVCACEVRRVSGNLRNLIYIADPNTVFLKRLILLFDCLYVVFPFSSLEECSRFLPGARIFCSRFKRTLTKKSTSIYCKGISGVSSIVLEVKY